MTDGRVAIVTGASRGIGAATARRLARDGFAVVVNYHRSEDAAANVAGSIRAAGGSAIAIGADASDEGAVERLFAETAQRLGPVRVLVNNAGVIGRSTRLVDAELALLEEVLRGNVVSTFLCSRAAVRTMSSARGGVGGAIVNVSSAAATLGGAGEIIPYAASKGAIDTFTIGLAREVAAEGIRVNAVQPGMIDTDMQTAGGDPGRIARIVPTVPMQRIGSPGEVADAIAYLASDAASYVTGAILRVGGGR